MKLVPPPPPAVDGELAVSRRSVVVSLRHGLLSGCVMCGSSSCTYWPHEGRFHPVHELCTHRLIEHWLDMLTATEDDAPSVPIVAPSIVGGSSAYARRAARLAAKVGAPAVPVALPSAVAPVIPDDVQANPFWRPGMGPDEPWTVVTETTAGRQHTPCDTHREHAMEIMDFAEHRSRVDARLDGGVITLGGCVVAPDGSVATSWGTHAPPFGAPLYRRLIKVSGGGSNWGWTPCRKCKAWLWPGRWIVEETWECGSCAGPDDGGRVWPDEPRAPHGLTEPPPPPPKRKGQGQGRSV